jgi:hypothetical protein
MPGLGDVGMHVLVDMYTGKDIAMYSFDGDMIWLKSECTFSSPTLSEIHELFISYGFPL